MTISIPDDLLYGTSQNATVKKPGDFRRRGPDGPPWVSSPDKTRKPKGLKAELIDKANQLGHDVPDKITVPELQGLLGPEPADVLYGRPSAFGEMLDNPYNLIRWKERKLLVGLAKSWDGMLDDFDDSSELDGIIAQAYEAADHMLAAHRGTHVHLIVEHVLRGQASGHLIGDGERLGIPAPLQVRIAESYVAFRQALGVRSIAVELAIVNDWWKVAGTLDCLDYADRLIETPFGTICGPFIADVKTGGLKDADDTPSWWIKYGPQVCAYADGTPYDVDREIRLEWPATPHPDVALIYHYDLARALDGEPVAWQAIPVNLAAARAGGEIVKAAQLWAKRDDLFAPPITIEGAPCDTTSSSGEATRLDSTSSPLKTDQGLMTSTSSPTTTSDVMVIGTSTKGTTVTGSSERSETPPTLPSPSTSTAASSANRDALRVQRLVADRVTDEMLLKPSGELTEAEVAILTAVLHGAYADEVTARLDAFRAARTITTARSRDALRARIAELVAAGHEPLIRQAWPHGVAPLSKPGHTDDDLALILTAVRRVESGVSWPFRPEDGTVATPSRKGSTWPDTTSSTDGETPSNSSTESTCTSPDPEDTPPTPAAVPDESPPRPTPQRPDEGGDVDPAAVAALQAAFAALPDPARQAIGIISAEANVAGRPISVTQSPTVRRWSIARALVAWARSDLRGMRSADDLEDFNVNLWYRLGQILDSSQVTDDDTTLGALIGALTREQADLLHDTFDITVAT